MKKVLLADEAAVPFQPPGTHWVDEDQISGGLELGSVVAGVPDGEVLAVVGGT
jgi:hypothetical protein